MKNLEYSKTYPDYAPTYPERQRQYHEFDKQRAADSLTRKPGINPLVWVLVAVAGWAAVVWWCR